MSNTDEMLIGCAFATDDTDIMLFLLPRIVLPLYLTVLQTHVYRYSGRIRYLVAG